METTLDFYEEGIHGKFISYSLYSKFEWPYKDSYFTIEFSDRIMPYFFELKKRFTQYPIGILQKLSNRNTIRIYEYCRMNRHSKKKSFTWTVYLMDFKRILDLENKHSRFNTFMESVLVIRILLLMLAFTSTDFKIKAAAALFEAVFKKLFFNIPFYSIIVNVLFHISFSSSVLKYSGGLYISNIYSFLYIKKSP